MADFRTRNRQIAAALQVDSLGGANYGVEASVNAATDALKARVQSQMAPQFDSIDTDYLQGALDQSAPETGGGMMRINLSCYLKGAGTAGAAPDYGRVLRASGFSETLTAADIEDTAQGGDSDSITLAAGASATDNLYVGMPIVITDGEGEGQTRVIAAYDGTSKVATVYPGWGTAPDETSEYQIPANALYRPVSVGHLPLSLVEWSHSTKANAQSRRRRLMDGAATFTLSVNPRQLAAIDFTVTGKLPANPDDVAKPAAPIYQSADPKVVVNALSYLGGKAVCYSEFSFDLGNDVQMFDCADETFGYSPASIVNRAASGRVVPKLEALTQRDAWADWMGGINRPFWTMWGPAAGNRIGLYIPELRYIGNTPADVRGFVVEQLPFRSVQPDGAIFICVF